MKGNVELFKTWYKAVFFELRLSFRKHICERGDFTADKIYCQGHGVTTFLAVFTLSLPSDTSIFESKFFHFVKQLSYRVLCFQDMRNLDWWPISEIVFSLGLGHSETASFLKGTAICLFLNFVYLKFKNCFVFNLTEVKQTSWI